MTAHDPNIGKRKARETTAARNPIACRRVGMGGLACFYCFPVLPSRKEPAIKNNLELATTDAAQIDKWWTENPDYNIRGGPTHLSGNIVLDIDPPLGFVTLQGLEAAHCKLPLTRTFTTPRGGLHYWFEGGRP